MIKKVIIPQIEVRYICELSEQEFDRSKAIVCHDPMVETLEEKWHKREIQKPLEDDEVSVDDVSDGSIYAFICNGIVMQFSKINTPEYFIMELSRSFSYSQKGYSSLKEIMSKIITGIYFTGKRDIYEFSGENKQQEFFEWALKQLGGNK